MSGGQPLSHEVADDCASLTHQPASLRISHRPTLPAPTRCGVGNSPARAFCAPARAHAAMATRSRPLCSGPPASAGLTILSLELPCRKLGLMAKGLHLDITIATARSPYRCRLATCPVPRGDSEGLPNSCPKGERPPGPGDQRGGDE